MPGNKTKVSLAAGDWGHAIPVAVANIWAVLRNRFPVSNAAVNSGGGGSSGGGTVNNNNGVGSRWVLTASGPFTVPVTGQYTAKTIGGGGGGTPSRVLSGYYYYYGVTKAAGTPGGAGEVKSTTIGLTGGQVVTATVGNGGVNANGGLTSFGAFLTSLGGLFGSGAQYNGESYGAGGVGGVPNLSSAVPDPGGAGQPGAIIITRVA